ncbi:MAG: phosphotransferase [Saprospiraceae bacterium]
MQADQHLKDLATKFWGNPPDKIEALAKAGSDRIYHRLSLGAQMAISTFNPNIAENKAFIYLSKHFQSKGIHVPEILAESGDGLSYLQSDLGDRSLFDHLQANGFSAALPFYQKSLLQLSAMQFQGTKAIDPDQFFARPIFDRVSMRWDLDYAKYYFFRYFNPDLDESAWERDCDTLLDWLETAERSCFMHRDFQSRNIMIADGETYFIDFQGGRMGHPAYDLASLLLQARAGLSAEQRNELLEYYIAHVATFSSQWAASIRYYYPGFVWLRVLQTLGSYGYRGILQQKPHFLLSLDPAIKQASLLTQIAALPFDLSYIREQCAQLEQHKPWKNV